MCIDLTISNFVVAVARAGHSLLFNFGPVAKLDSKLSKTQAQSLHNLNGYRSKMDNIYETRFPGYYVMFDEENVEWC